MGEKAADVLAKVVLVSGKGGVGKTTVAAALALAQAGNKKRAVLVEFGDGLSGARALGPAVSKLKHQAIETEQAIVRTGKHILGSGLLTRLVVGNFAMRRLLRAGPGLRELALLETVRQISEANPKAKIVVDMPATGHGLAWLRVPSQFITITSPSPFRDLAKNVQAELLDPGKSSLLIVTLPERMVLRETLELCEAVSKQVGLEPAQLVVNQVPEDVSDELLQSAQAFAKESGALSPSLRILADILEARHAARREALEALEEVTQRGHRPPILLPQLPFDPNPETVAQWLRQGGLR